MPPEKLTDTIKSSPAAAARRKSEYQKLIADIADGKPIAHPESARITNAAGKTLEALHEDVQIELAARTDRRHADEEKALTEDWAALLSRREEFHRREKNALALIATQRSDIASEETKLLDRRLALSISQSYERRRRVHS